MIRNTFIVLFFFSCFNITAQRTVISVGEAAPNFTSKTIQGEKISLSDYKGNLILLTFWASWSRPSRAANPELLRLHEKYKNKRFRNATGFTVITVSLDKKEESWRNAISVDKMEWKEHLCSLKYWDDPIAVEYGIDFIPTFILIDSEMKVKWVSKSLEGLDPVIEKQLR